MAQLASAYPPAISKDPGGAGAGHAQRGIVSSGDPEKGEPRRGNTYIDTVAGADMRPMISTWQIQNAGLFDITPCGDSYEPGCASVVPPQCQV
jgi:hypothetical protein